MLSKSIATEALGYRSFHSTAGVTATWRSPMKQKVSTSCPSLGEAASTVGTRWWWPRVTPWWPQDHVVRCLVQWYSMWSQKWVVNNDWFDDWPKTCSRSNMVGALVWDSVRQATLTIKSINTTIINIHQPSITIVCFIGWLKGDFKG